MWRKLAEYGFHSLCSLAWPRRRFFWVRSAAALGEVAGRRESSHRAKGLKLPPDRGILAIESLALLTAAAAVVAWLASDEPPWAGMIPALAVAAAGTAALLAKSLTNFSQTGPRIREEILTHYGRYTLFALARLSLWAFALMLFTGSGGVLVYHLLNLAGPNPVAVARRAGAVLGCWAQAGCNSRASCASIRTPATSMHYRWSRFYPLWQWCTPRYSPGSGAPAGTIVLLASPRRGNLIDRIERSRSSRFGARYFLCRRDPLRGMAAGSPRTPRRSRPGCAAQHPSRRPDTLRADRLGAFGYRRALTRTSTLWEAGRAVQKLLRPLRANCAQPRFDVDRDLAAYTWHSRQLHRGY
jgi:hypothetical protein